MVWKEKLEKLIEGAKKAREVEKKINAVREVLNQLDEERVIEPFSEEDIKYYREDDEVVCIVEVPPHWADMLRDFEEYILGEKYRCVEIGIEVSTKDKHFNKDEDINKRVLMTGNDYRGRMLDVTGYYRDYIFLGSTKVNGINVYVYLVFYTERKLPWEK